MDRLPTFSDNFIDALELIWGAGFLSPGGLPELERIVGSLDLSGLRALDIGCGVGGYSLGLLTQHKMSAVVGLDIEESVLQRAIETARASRLDRHALFSLISPGPIPVAGDCVDVVFGKDSFLSITDKSALFPEIYSVLHPQGWLLASDWLAGRSKPFSSAMNIWLDSIDADLELLTPTDVQQMLAGTGFEDVEVIDRSDWAKLETARDLQRISGELKPALVRLLGKNECESLEARTRLRLQAITDGDLTPSHIRARKPG